MAVIVSNGDVSLGAENGFLRSDAYNVGAYGSVGVAASATALLNTSGSILPKIITFGNTGKCKGIIFGISSYYVNPGVKANKSITADLEQTKGTATLAVASPGVVGLSSHDLSVNQRVRFTTAGTLPTGITSNYNYYVAPVLVSPTNMTNNTSPSPFVASASTELTTYLAYNAFQTGLAISQSWMANTSTGWLKIDLGATKVVTRYGVAAPTTYFATRSPNAWSLEASNTGSFSGEEIILDTQSAQTTWIAGQEKVFDFVNTTGYRYYRVNCTANNGDTYVAIAELRLHEASTNAFSVSTTPTGSLINFTGTSSGTHTCWATVNSKTLTAAECNPELNDTTPAGDLWTSFLPFEFDDGGTTINTTASAWRVACFLTGTVGGAHYILCSDATALEPFFVTWSDNAVNASSGSDAIWCKDKVTIDKSFTLKGYLANGDAAYAHCGGICRSLNLTKEGNENLIWQNPPAASYTFTIDGMFYLSSYSGIKVGDASNNIPFAQQAIINFATPTVGTNGLASLIINPYIGTTSGVHGKTSLLLYGEIPVKRSVTLAQDASISQNIIIVSEDVSAYWHNDDYLFIGKQDVKNGGTNTWHQIQSINGTSITLKTNLATNVRKSGGYVVNRDAGYGIKITRPNALYYTLFNPGFASHLEIHGVVGYQSYFSLSTVTGSTTTYLNYIQPQAAYCSKWVINDNLFWSESTTYYSLMYPSTYFYINPLGFDMKRNLFNRVAPVYAIGGASLSRWKSGILTFEYNVVQGLYLYGFNFTSTNSKTVFNNNVYENSLYASYNAAGAGAICKNNYFWGIGTSPIVIGQSVNFIAENNTFENCTYGYSYGALTSVNFASLRDIFSNIETNTIYVQAGGAYVTGRVIDSSGTITFDNTYLPDLSADSKIAFTNTDGITNNDAVYTPTGVFQRCGVGLTDITTLGTNSFSLRFAPVNEIDLLQWTQNIPTGNIQNKTMVVMCKVKINSANYYANVHQKPRLSVNYDNGTVVYVDALANTDVQTLSLVISPITTYSQITVTISGATDATGTDSYFYVGDGQSLYPAGHQVNTGDMSLWADAFPVTPWIATNLTEAGVWAYLKSTATVTGSMGEQINSLLSEDSFLALK